jgi:anti-sigma factor RsiW
MKKPDHDTFREWLQLAADSDLSPERREFLERHLAECPECQAERRDLAHLSRALERGRLAVRTDFRQRVIEALPPAGWEARHPRTWRFPGSVAVLLGIVAAAFFGRGSAASGPAGGSPIWGALLAIAGFFRATLVAGLGLMQASWKGLGLVCGEIFSSWPALAAFAVLVICLNLLLLSLVRRRAPSPAAEGMASTAKRGGPSRG